MKAPDWYAEWRHDAVHELMEKQDRLKVEFDIDAWPRFDYDSEAGCLTFSADGVRAEIQVVGTTGSEDWLWGWANDHWPGSYLSDVRRVRDYGLDRRIEELTTEYLESDDLNALGCEMTAVAARVVNAVGAYRPPSETGAIFLLYRSIAFVS